MLLGWSMTLSEKSATFRGHALMCRPWRNTPGISMQRKVIISCAVTGSADTPGKNPAVPVTPQQIAQSAIDAAKAGAAIVHIHVRDPQTTRPSMDKALYREVVERIRASGT